MPLEVFFAVLGAAALHAAWNAVVKGGDDPFEAAAWTAFGGAIVCVPPALWLGLPHPSSYLYVVLSGVIHLFYFAGVGLAYRTVDLGVAYPLMRGGAPLATASLGTVLLGEPLAGVAWIGIALISGGILALAAQAVSKGRLTLREAGVVAIMIAIIVAYTIADGLGARLSGSPVSYIAWTWVLTALLLAPVHAVAGRASLLASARRYGRRGILAGTFSTISYGTALWAMTKAPIGLVAALRETSVLFAMLIGSLFLKEPWSGVRMAAAAAIVAGLAALRLG